MSTKRSLVLLCFKEAIKQEMKKRRKACEYSNAPTTRVYGMLLVAFAASSLPLLTDTQSDVETLTMR